MPARTATHLRRALDALRRRLGPARAARVRRRRVPARPGAEALGGRRLLATVTLADPTGPIRQLILGDDGTFQVERQGFTSGQVYPPSTQTSGPVVLAPGDAGLFIRQADGTVDGLNPADHARSAAKSTHSVGLHPISLTASADGRSATLVADNAGDGNTLGNHFTLVQMTTLHPGDPYFRVDDTILNTGSTPITLDLFAAADLYLADDDYGNGYYDAATGSVGGMDQSGTYRIFIQPNPSGGLTPTAYKEGYFRDEIWGVIGSGGNFNNTIDSNYLDNGAGLEWGAVTIAPGHAARVSYFWSFGATAPAPVPPSLSAQAKTLDLTVGTPFDGTVGTFTSTDPNAEAGDFRALVAWGDGSADTLGTVQADASGGFTVAASHTYADAGSYPLRVTIVSQDGAADIAHGLARVVAKVVTPPPTGGGGGSDGGDGGSGGGGSGGGGSDGTGSGSGSGGAGSGGSTTTPPASPSPADQFAGGLDPGSDTGASSTDRITSDRTPSFGGTAQAGSVVTLAALSAEGALIDLGTVEPDGAGHWSLTVATPLADGAYTLYAHVQPASGPSFNVALGGLVIDTTPPRITGLTVHPTAGTMLLTVQDAGAGLDLASLADASNYTFSRRWQRFGVSVAAVQIDPTNPLRATVELRTPGRIGHGHRFILTAASGGLRDLAGNALDGEFAGRFPTGDGTPGGGFAVRIPTDGFKVLPYHPVRSLQSADLMIRRHGRRG